MKFGEETLGKVELKMKGKFEDKDFKKTSWTKENACLCVEVAIKPEGVAVRNSNDRSKNTVFFTPNEWAAFVKGVKGNEFNAKGRIQRRLR